jgi:hypothetical protein
MSAFKASISGARFEPRAAHDSYSAVASDAELHSNVTPSLDRFARVYLKGIGADVDLGCQSQHHRLDDREDRCGGQGRCFPRRPNPRRQSRVRHAEHRGLFDEAFAVPGLLAEMAKAPESDAFIIACFDDTGLEAARCAAISPVVGIGEAAFHMASLIADKIQRRHDSSSLDRADREESRQIRPCRTLRARTSRQRASACP